MSWHTSGDGKMTWRLVLICFLTAPALYVGLLVCAGPWLLVTDVFNPRTACGTGWTVGLTSVAMLTETLIFFCYMFLAFAAVVVCKKLLSATLIEVTGATLWSGFIFGCGMTHLTSRLMFQWPAYHLDTLTRVYTVCYSLAAVLHAGWVLGGGGKRA